MRSEPGNSAGDTRSDAKNGGTHEGTGRGGSRAELRDTDPKLTDGGLTDGELTGAKSSGATLAGAPAYEVRSTNGVMIAVHDLGGSGPPLLLCHATGFHGRVWQPVAERLDHRCLAPDLRGHGDSEIPAGVDIDWNGFGDDVLAVIDSLGLTDVIAAGHSKGGAALVLAEQARPGTFRSMYLFEPILFPQLPASAMPSATRSPSAAKGANPMADAARRRRPTFESFDAAYENYASKPPLDALHPDALRAYVDHGFARAADGSVIIKCRPEVEAATFEMGLHHDGFERLGEVRCKVTVARGSLAAPGPASIAEAIVEALPDATLEEHPDLGHFGPLEDPVTMAACIERALGS